MSRTDIGHASLVDALNYRASTEADRAFLSYSNAEDLQQCHSLNFATVKKAVDKMSWWLDALLKGEEHSQRTVCYLGATDVSYLFMYVAAVQTNCKVRIERKGNG
jgi:hypothetical protein